MSERLSIQQRIRRGEIRQRDVVRRLAELAFAPVNDCVRLVREDLTEEELRGMDLRLVDGIKRDSKGNVEIQLVDRILVLRELAALVPREKSGAEAFLESLRDGA